MLELAGLSASFADEIQELNELLSISSLCIIHQSSPGEGILTGRVCEMSRDG